MSDKNRLSDSSAKSYSQALYELASEEKKLNDVEEHTISIIKLISQSEDFNSLIKDPTNKQEDQLNVINLIFANNRISPKVSSTKSAHGHVMGATGAIELLSCILALREHVIVPTLGLIKKDPKIKLDLVCGETQEKRVETVISNSFAFGGLNSTIVLKAV